jgi:hypothetical protein
LPYLGFKVPLLTHEAELDAPIDDLWSLLVDFENYGRWNPFVPKLECLGPVAAGTAIRLEVHWPRGGKVISPERLVEVRAPRSGAARLTYVYEGLAAKLKLLRSIRSQELLSLDAGRTRWRSEFDCGGILEPFLPIDQIELGFASQGEAMARALAG